MPVKKLSRRILAAGLLLTGILLACFSTFAAGRVDLTKTGTLTFEPGGENAGELAEDFAGIKEPVGVHVWQLAEISGTGAYTVNREFSGLSIRDDAWDEVKDEAMALVYGGDDPTVDPLIRETASGTLADGLTGLPLGLYLVVIDPACSDTREYTFNPMIVSLPWTEYRMGGSGSDTWQYTLNATLKAAVNPRYGDLRIVKTLTSQNLSQGDATFVFDIEGKDPNGTVVYSNVVSATFSEAGRQEILVTRIPAGTTVTVTEVYSGANCTLTASDNGPQVIVAEDVAGVSFTNAYDEEAKSGYGVENRFRYDTKLETYVWTTDRADVSAGAGQEVAE